MGVEPCDCGRYSLPTPPSAFSFRGHYFIGPTVTGDLWELVEPVAVWDYATVMAFCACLVLSLCLSL